LLEGCLDCQIKRQLQQKISHHKMKINTFG